MTGRSADIGTGADIGRASPGGLSWTRVDGLWLAALIGLVTVLSCFSMDDYPLAGHDELRYARVSDELSGRGDWWRLTFLGREYDEKPPLGFWLMAGARALTGPSGGSWAYRLPGCLGAMAVVCLTYVIGRRGWGRPVGVVAACLLMTMPLFVRQSVQARLDMMYAAWMTAAMALWYLADTAGRMSRASRVGFWLCLLAAFLTRNALAPVMLLACIALVARWRRDSAAWRLIAPLPGLSFYLAFIAGWYVLQGVIYQKGVVNNQLREQFLDRMDTAAPHAKPLWFYLGNLPAEGAAACGVIALIAAVQAWQAHRRGTPSAYPAWLWAWPGLFVGVMSLVPTKRPEYLLPIYPALALVSAVWLHNDLSRVPIARVARRISVTVYGLLAAAMLAVGAVKVIDPQSLPSIAPAPGWWYPGVFLAAGTLFLVTAYFALGARDTRRLVHCGLIAVLLGVGVYLHGVRPFSSDADRTHFDTVFPASNPPGGTTGQNIGQKG